MKRMEMNVVCVIQRVLRWRNETYCVFLLCDLYKPVVFVFGWRDGTRCMCSCFYVIILTSDWQNWMKTHHMHLIQKHTFFLKKIQKHTCVTNKHYYTICYYFVVIICIRKYPILSLPLFTLKWVKNPSKLKPLPISPPKTEILKMTTRSGQLLTELRHDLLLSLNRALIMLARPLHVGTRHG